MASQDLVISDGYIRAVSEYYKTCGKFLDDILLEYLWIMDADVAQAFQAGETANALGELSDYARNLKDLAGSIAANAASYAQLFLNDIDDADDYLF